MNIKIVPQKREFGCAKAVIKTAIKTKYGMDISIKDPRSYINGIGTLSFLGMANGTLHSYHIPAKFVKKTNVKMDEIQQWIVQEKIMIVLFISRENYPHYAVISGKDDKSIFIANTHGALIERFDLYEFIERFYMNPRYIDGIQWKKGRHHPFRDRLIRWSIKLAKLLGFVKSGTMYVLEEKT